jgi:hypothetical protein
MSESSGKEAVFSQSEIYILECIWADLGLGSESWSNIRGIACSIFFSGFSSWYR